MGSNIYFFSLHEEARKYIKEIQPTAILPQEISRDLTYEDLKIIFKQLTQWGWNIEGYRPDATEFDVYISREINGDEGRNLDITLWIKKDNGNPRLIFHKDRHSIALLIVKEIAILCGAQCVCNDSDFGDCHVITDKTDITLLMKDWLKEDLYGDYWQQKIEQ